MPQFAEEQRGKQWSSGPARNAERLRHLRPASIETLRAKAAGTRIAVLVIPRSRASRLTRHPAPEVHPMRMHQAGDARALVRRQDGEARPHIQMPHLHERATCPETAGKVRTCLGSTLPCRGLDQGSAGETARLSIRRVLPIRAAASTRAGRTRSVTGSSVSASHRAT